MAGENTFGRVDPTKLSNDNLIKYKYMMNLSGLTGISILDWPVDLLQKVESTSKREINKFFFAHSESINKSVPGVTSEQLQEIERAAGEAAKSFVQQRISELSNNIQYHMNNVTRYDNAAENERQSAFRLMREKEVLNQGDKGGEKIAREISNILSEGFFVFNRISTLHRGEIHFLTKDPVIMSEVNPAAGVHRAVNLGTYKIVLNLGNGAMKLRPQGGNTSVGGFYYHPYVSNDGNICWGNAKSRVRELTAKMEYSSIFRLLRELLITYDPNSGPYVALHAFEEEQKARKKAEEIIRCDECSRPTNQCSCDPPCDICGNSSEECGCVSCHVCDEMWPEAGVKTCDCCWNCDSTADECGC